MPTAIQRVSTLKLKGPISALDFTDFDTTPFIQFNATKYLIEISRPDGANFQALEVFATKILSDVDDQLYTKFAYGLKVKVKVFKDGSDVKLRITNLENFLVNAKIIKQQL